MTVSQSIRRSVPGHPGIFFRQANGEPHHPPYAIKYDQNGKTIGPRGSYNSLREAKDAKASTRVEKIRGVRFNAVSKLTVEQAIEAWLAKPRKKPLAAGSISAYRRSMRLIPRNVLDAKTRDFGTAHIEALQKAIADKSGSVQGQVLMVISGALNRAVWTGDAASNAINSLPRGDRPSRKPMVVKRPLQRDEIPKLLQAATPGWQRILLELAIYTGMRQSEILGLKWGKVDFDKNEILVDRQFTVEAEYKETKTSEQREVDIAGTPLPKALREWSIANGRPDADRYVFERRPNERPKTHQAARAVLGRTLKRAGLEPRRFHDLRVTRASMLANPRSGVPVTTAAKQLGHTVKEFLQTYVAEFDEKESRELLREANLRLTEAIQAS